MVKVGKTSKTLLIIITTSIVVVAGLFLQKLKENSKPYVRVGKTKVYVDIAKTSGEKQKGLSGWKSLGKKEGMLFVFKEKTSPYFWMKDMKFPIDIIWIADGKIIYIHKNIPPPIEGADDSQPTLYSPPSGIDYVLEVNAGFSDKNNLKPEDKVDLVNIK